MQKAIRAWLLLISPLLLIILSADLLYLYFVGPGWFDPTKWIEYAEVGLLVSFIFLGIWAFWQTLKGMVQ